MSRTNRLALVAAGGALAVTAGVVGATSAQAATVPAANAQEVAPTPVAVSMGDSFISGEGGRFAGSVYNNLRSDGESDEGPTTGAGASIEIRRGNRSVASGSVATVRDSAEINGAARAFGQVPINLACSGSTTADILFQSRRTEAPQIQQLSAIAQDKTKQIKTIAVSIGGNDGRIREHLGGLHTDHGVPRLWDGRYLRQAPGQNVQLSAPTSPRR